MNLNTLRIAYYSLFQSHLQYGAKLWGQKNQEIKEIMQKPQNRALRKICFNKFRHSVKHTHKDHKMLKFANILKVQNCLFMFQVEQNNALGTFFLPSTPKTNSITRPHLQSKNLIEVTLARTNKYGNDSVKYQCIRDWNNLKKKFPQIPENKLSLYENQKNSKESCFWSILNVLFTTINFYMCILYYFYFLSSRVIQMTLYFMILLVLMFIVNQNFKFLNRCIILLLLSFVLLSFAFCIFYVLIVCVIASL